MTNFAITVNGAENPDGAQLSAIKWALELRRSEGGNILLYIPQKTSIDECSHLGQFSKEPGVLVSSWKSPSRQWFRGPLIAAWPDTKHLDRICRTGSATGICVIPWRDEDVAQWKQDNEPKLLPIPQLRNK